MILLSDELEERLFIEMLNLSRKGAGPIFDLRAVCQDTSLEVSDQQLLVFINDNHGIHGSKERTTMGFIHFELSPDGMRKAKEIERQQRTPKVVRNLVGDTSQKLFNIGNSLISIVALGVAVAAYFKDAS